MVHKSFAQLRDQFPDQCVIGNGTADKDGYVRIGIGTKSDVKRYGAHRLAYRLFIGDVKGCQVVMHTCDNPSCINPKHLRLGSHDDNMRDMAAKKRKEWGAEHYNAKLTEEQVRSIRADKRLHKEIAADYGISRATVTNIRARRIWQHLED